MKKILIILSLFNLISCGNIIRDVFDIKSKPKHLPTDVEFIKYRDKFNHEFKTNSSVAIAFEDITQYHPTALAACFKYTNGKRKVGVRKDTWSSLVEKQKEQLIFHELGHCALDKDHNDNHIYINRSLCPESIMRSYLFNKKEIDNCYNIDYNHYVQEMI